MKSAELECLKLKLLPETGAVEAEGNDPTRRPTQAGTCSGVPEVK